jgi:hypothetical protein
MRERKRPIIETMAECEHCSCDVEMKSNRGLGLGFLDHNEWASPFTASGSCRFRRHATLGRLVHLAPA